MFRPQLAFLQRRRTPPAVFFELALRAAGESLFDSMEQSNEIRFAKGSGFYPGRRPLLLVMLAFSGHTE